MGHIGTNQSFQIHSSIIISLISFVSCERIKTELDKIVLSDFTKNLSELMDTYKPDAVSMEELYFNNNAKTAFAVGQARGVALLAAAKKNIPIFSYTPLQVKQSVTGYGRADKNQVQQMVKSFLNLRAVPKPDDVADALAMAICHAHSYGYNALIEKYT